MAHVIFHDDFARPLFFSNWRERNACPTTHCPKVSKHMPLHYLYCNTGAKAKPQVLHSIIITKATSLYGKNFSIQAPLTAITKAAFQGLLQTKLVPANGVKFHSSSVKVRGCSGRLNYSYSCHIFLFFFFF